MTESMRPAPSFSDYRPDPIEEATEEWQGTWDDTETYKHFVAERDGRVVRAPPALPPAARPARAGRLDRSRAGVDRRPPSAARASASRSPRHAIAWAHEQGYPTMTTDWRMTNLLASRFWPRRGFRPTFLRRATASDPVDAGFPLLAGLAASPVVDAPEDAVVLRPPAPASRSPTSRSAVRDALRFPLAGQPLEALVDAGRPRDDRGRAARAAVPRLAAGSRAGGDWPPTLDELERARHPAERADAPRRRRAAAPRRRSASSSGCVTPAFAPPLPRPRRRPRRRGPGPCRARRRRDARPARPPARSSRRTWSSTVTAAETVLDGGPQRCSPRRRRGAAGGGAPLAARDARPRGAGSSRVALERRSQRRVPLIGASLVAQPPAPRRRRPRLPVRAGARRADRPLAAPRGCSASRPRRSHARCSPRCRAS